jgi:hypothetical protein
VELNNKTEIPDNIKRVAARPIFDAVTVSNYIWRVLHIGIGIRNNLVDILIEWIEERVEKLMPEEILARTAVVYADRNEECSQNMVIILVDKLLESQQITFIVLAKDDDTGAFFCE